MFRFSVISPWGKTTVSNACIVGKTTIYLEQNIKKCAKGWCPKKDVNKRYVFVKGMKVGLKEKSGKKKKRVFWSNVRSVNACCGAAVLVTCDWELVKIFLSLSNENLRIIFAYWACDTALIG